MTAPDDTDDWCRGDPAEQVAGGGVFASIARLLPDWHREAECRDVPTVTFFPSRGESSRHALELCGMCSVRELCLDEAIADPALDFGVRGGMSAHARKQRRRTQKREDRDAQT